MRLDTTNAPIHKTVSEVQEEQEEKIEEEFSNEIVEIITKLKRGEMMQSTKIAMVFEYLYKKIESLEEQNGKW